MSDYTFKDLTQLVGVPANEKETTTNAPTEDGKAKIYTNENPMITKFRKLCKSFPNVYKVEQVHKNPDGEKTGYSLLVPRELLSFRSPREGRKLSDEERAGLSERMKANRANMAKARL
jgi:hypothetical protein